MELHPVYMQHAWEFRNVCKCLVWKPERKEPLDRLYK